MFEEGIALKQQYGEENVFDLSLGNPVMDPPQEAKVVRRAAEIARDLGVDEELTRDVIWRIIAAARDAQDGNNESGPTSIEVDEDTT